MASFRRFRDLPTELRHLVWDLAIRDHEPAAHFLSVYSTLKEHKIIVDASKMVRLGIHAPDGRPWVTKSPVGLAAPLQRDVGEHSWTEGNHSAYMEDSGLWTACRESRVRMLCRYRPEKLGPEAATRSSTEDHNDPASTRRGETTAAASVTLGFRRENRERQYLTICPSVDLVCIQIPAKSWYVSVDHLLQHSDVVSDLCTLDSVCSWTAGGLENMAVELEVGLMMLFQASFPNAFKRLCREGTFWTIDYRLKPMPGPEGRPRPLRPDRKRFRGAGGCVFVEVRPLDDAEWFGNDEPHMHSPIVARSRDPTSSTVKGHLVARQTVLRFTTYLGSWRRMLGREGVEGVKRIGILACVDEKDGIS